MNKRRRFTSRFKAQVVLEVLTGRMTAAQVCRAHELKESVLSHWKREFIEHAPELFDKDKGHSEATERIGELERMVGRLTMELEISKKPRCS